MNGPERTDHYKVHLPIERRGGRDGGGSRTPVRPVGRSKRPWNKGLLIGQKKSRRSTSGPFGFAWIFAGIIRCRLVSCSSARGILRGHGANLHEEQWHARQVLWCRRSSMQEDWYLRRHIHRQGIPGFQVTQSTLNRRPSSAHGLCFRLEPTCRSYEPPTKDHVRRDARDGRA